SSVLGFWRPGYGAPIRVGDTAGVDNNFMGVSLAFFGPNPRLAVFADLDPSRTRSPSYATQSNDGGITWSPLAYLPSETGQVQGGHISLAVGSRGQGAVVLERLRGNNQGQCGDPLLSRSSDFLNWTTCTASGPNPPSVEAHDARVAFDAADRLYLAFQNAKNGDLPIGVILWYEPLSPTAVSAAVPVAAVAAAPEISTGGVVNAASFERSLAPGGIATIFGTNLTAASQASASSTPLPEKLGETVVLVNGIPAPLLLVTSTQINFQIPYETSPGMASVGVVADGSAGKIVQVNIATTAPGIFTNGSGSGVIQNEDYLPNGPLSPAKAGSYVVIYATGGGRTDNAVPSGTATPHSPLSRSLQPVKVRIGNRESVVSFCGLTPGFAGLMQVNVQVPDLPAGTYTVQIISGSASSNQPNISIQ
ncbi:MAG: hypothetical protein M3Z36_07240, partial [Acidobacteriota bacterium]|nr:hypothetical protein [Acidobacteriota bacterium]